MNAAVTYFSRTGNTKKVADAIAKTIRCTAETVSGFYADRPADILFIGGAVYGGKLDPSLIEFIGRLDPKKIKRAVVFSTHVYPNSTADMIKSALKDRGINTDERSFTCKGKFLFFSRKHPDGIDLKEAASFAASIVS